MADTIKTTFTGKIILPLQSGETTANRAITVYEPVTLQSAVESAIASLSAWLRNDETEDPDHKRLWLFQPTASWEDGDPSSSAQPETISSVAWSLSAAEPIRFETTEKTVRVYNEQYGVAQ